jgi:hypothetical protein
VIAATAIPASGDRTPAPGPAAAAPAPLPAEAPPPTPRGASPAALADLRARLAAMGGIADLSRPAPPRPRPASPATAAQRGADLGFEVQGSVLVRQVSIDLGPFLERAGVTASVRPDDLVRLLLRLPPGAPVGPIADGETAALDIETVGLRGSGVLPFLVGVGVLRGSSLELCQWLLADLDSEPAMLDALAARLAGRRLLLTYNGRTFDMPVLEARCLINRRPPESLSAALHCDLLAPVRRLFRDRLGACTLRQAELSLLGLERDGDVPGAEAPARFHAWLRGASSSVLEGVVRHNQLDVCATAVLGARLAAHASGCLVRPVHPADRYRLGVHLEALGLDEAAQGHLAAAFRDTASPWSRPAGHRLARRLGRLGRPATDGTAASATARSGPGAPSLASLAVLAELWRRHPDDLAAARGLALTLERSGDLAGAVRICAEAERALAARRLWQRRLATSGRTRMPLDEEWRRRRRRLERRLARALRHQRSTALLAAG